MPGGDGTQGPGIARVSRALGAERPGVTRRRVILRLILLGLVVITSLVGWQVTLGIQHKRLQGALDNVGRTLETRWADTNLWALRPARSLCDELDAGTVATAERFAEKGKAIRQAGDLYEAMYWLGNDGAYRASVATDSGDPANSLPFGADSLLWSQLRRTASGGQPIVGPVYEGSFGRMLVLLYFPLDTSGSAGGGGLAVVLRMSRLMEHFVDADLRELVSLDLARNGQIIYRTGDYLVERHTEYETTVKLKMLDLQWTCRMVATSRFVKQNNSMMPEGVLGVGALGCIAAGALVLDAMKRRWQYTILEKGHVQVIDVISELTATIAAKRGEGGNLLARLVDAARPISQSDEVSVYRLTQDRRQLERVCASGDMGLRDTISLDLPSTDVLRPVLDGKPLVISPRQQDAAAVLGVFANGSLRSAVVVPLMRDRVVGVMVFGSRDSAPWTEGRVALARLWASQAASILMDETIQSQMRSALAVQVKLARRREMMLTVLGEIYQAGTIDQTLGRIAQLSPKALGVEACFVAMRTRREGELEIVAATGDLEARYKGVKVQPTGDCALRLLKPDTVALVGAFEMQAAGFAALGESWLVGLAAVPMLYGDGRAIGCVLLLAAAPGTFTDDQLDLARVLASRASAAVENTELNQQIRRDADTRAMLLRELNHRVKNNLAGIVGLLSANTMPMPDNMRQWLDRVIERIGNIARAHELLAGGLKAISLAQLLEQVLPSLAVIKPAGVVIRRELGDVEIWLKTTQAVSLAMVIHELCYNAIVHGLSSRGTLTIRAHLVENRMVVMEVIDDGTAAVPEIESEGGIATKVQPKSSTGLGLQLVKGLVGRELHGRFAMDRAQDSGTIVTVEFPLERD